MLRGSENGHMIAEVFPVKYLMCPVCGNQVDKSSLQVHFTGYTKSSQYFQRMVFRHLVTAEK